MHEVLRVYFVVFILLDPHPDIYHPRDICSALEISHVRGCHRPTVAVITTPSPVHALLLLLYSTDSTDNTADSLLLAVWWTRSLVEAPRCLGSRTVPHSSTVLSVRNTPCFFLSRLEFKLCCIRRNCRIVPPVIVQQTRCRLR